MDFKVKFGLNCVIALLFVIGVWLFAIQPKLKAVNQLKKDIVHYKAKVKGAEASISSVNDVGVDISNAEEELDRLRDCLPDSRERSWLLKKLSDVLDRHGVYVVSIKPRSEVVMDTPTRRPIVKMGIELKIDCTLEDLGRFLGSLAGLEEILLVDSFQISRKKDKKDTLGIDVILEAFFLE